MVLWSPLSRPYPLWCRKLHATTGSVSHQGEGRLSYIWKTFSKSLLNLEILSNERKHKPPERLSPSLSLTWRSFPMNESISHLKGFSPSLSLTWRSFPMNESRYTYKLYGRVSRVVRWDVDGHEACSFGGGHGWGVCPPLVVESLGVWTPSAKNIVSRIAARSIVHNGPLTASRNLLQQLSVKLWAYNAKMIITRFSLFPSPPDWVTSPFPWLNLLFFVLLFCLVTPLNFIKKYILYIIIANTLHSYSLELFFVQNRLF